MKQIKYSPNLDSKIIDLGDDRMTEKKPDATQVNKDNDVNKTINEINNI